MASFCITSLPLYPPTKRASSRPLHVQTPAAVAFSGHLSHRKTRGLTVVTRAGANTGSYVFAVVFPLSLLAVTIFASIRVADKLDKDFLEDLAINQAIREAEEEDAGDDGISLEDIVQEPVVPRTRNRPKKEV
ncbi:hypothetical protein REPUB_Repub03eG0238700 [Reevesia pubescens]